MIDPIFGGKERYRKQLVLPENGGNLECMDWFPKNECSSVVHWYCESRVKRGVVF